MLYANTDDGSSALWVLDDDGVVVDNISYSIGDRAQILAQINEHYGTSFTGWSDNEIGLRIGDTLPGWNAYEKIELPIRKISANFPPNLFGYVQGETAFIATSNNYSLIVNPESGEVTGTGPTIGVGFDTFVIDKLTAAGIEVNAAEGYDVPLVVGDTVPNWQEYERVIS